MEAASALFKELYSGDSLQSISVLKGGASNSGLYKVQGRNQNYVLRVLDKNRNPASIQREIEINQALGDAGVGPKIFAASVDKAALIMEEVQGGPLMSPKLSHDQIVDLATKIRQIHQLNLSTNQRPFTPKESAQQVINVDLGFPLPKEYEAALETLSPLFLKLEDKQKYTLTHGDLNPGNILMGKGIKIIDWEDAKISHPYIDIATIFIFYNLDTTERKLFLDTYTGQSNTIDPEELEAALKVKNYIYALALLGISYKVAQGGEAPKIADIETIRAQMNARRWFEIMPKLGQKDVAYTVSQVFLENALK